MSKLIKWSLIGVLAIALLIKISLWLSVRSIMSDAIAKLSPFMSLSYQGITSSFDGRVGIEGIKVEVPMINDEVHVAEAELRFNGLRELLSFKDRLAEGKLPEQMAVSLKGLSIDVHGPLMTMLKGSPRPGLEAALASVTCGSSSHIGVDELLEMGYRTLETELELSYLFRPGAQTLTLNLTADTHDMADYRLNLSMANMSEKPGDMRVTPPRVSSVVFELNDNQYQRKVNGYCSGKLALSEGEYLQASLAHLDGSLRSQRIALDPALLEALEAYYKDPQALRIELAPTEGVVWEGLQFFEPQDVLAMLRPVLLINQQAVEPLAFSWVDPQSAPSPEPNELVRVEAVESQAAPQYEFVNLESLPSHAGKRLQFITYDGAYYQGILHKVENGKVFLSVQMGSGSAEMFLRQEKIDKVRVLF